MRDNYRNGEQGKRNSEGYMDMTAYLALRHISKEEHMKDYNAGDIIEMETQYSVKEAVILAAHGTYATVLMLSDSEPRENSIEIRSRSVMYADMGKLGYCFDDKIAGYIRTMSDEELTELRAAVAETLGLDGILEDEEEDEELDEEDAAAESIEQTRHTDEEYERVRDAYLRADAGMSIYKGLYEGLMARFLPGKE